MQTGTFEKMSGEVEADETFVGGLARNMHASRRQKNMIRMGSMAGKTIVMGLIERRGKDKKCSTVRTRIVPDATQSSLQAVVHSEVEHGSKLYTDEHGGYRNLAFYYTHQRINHAEKYVEGAVHTNGVENYWSLLKRTIRGTYVSVEPFHLTRYLDEQAFRFNYRKLTDGERFMVAMSQIVGRRVTYRQLTGKVIPVQP